MSEQTIVLEPLIVKLTVRIIRVRYCSVILEDVNINPADATALTKYMSLYLSDKNSFCLDTKSV